MKDVSILVDYAKLLPEHTQTIAKLIGIGAALALVEQFGGTSIDVPLRKTQQGFVSFSLLVDAVGEQAATLLSLHYGATRLYIPNCKDALRRVRNIAMTKEYDQRTSQGKEKAKTVIADLARRYYMSDRHVWEIVNKATVDDWGNPEYTNKQEQLSLF